MQLSETITIYLAIAAPFGVNYFLRERSGTEQHRARSLFRATGAGLLWPFIAAAAFLARQSSTAPLPSSDESKATLDARVGEKIAVAQRHVYAALERVRELAQPAASGGEELEQGVRVVRQAIEKYVGLTMALAETSLDAPPAKHEMELPRIAGRMGDDLLLAGRCVHRRNVTRLIAHQARSRTELLHALATVREINNESPARSLPAVTAARHLSVAVLKFYGEAINLLSLLEDENAAMRAARLLDAECARLRQLEALSSGINETDRTDGKHARHIYTDQPTLARR
jgi:hypothetical protein